jgi:uncharacterized protein (TIGR02271 family)
VITTQQVQDLAGRTVLGTGDEKIGKVGEVYLDDTSGQPEWVTINTGLFGTSHSFAPLASASMAGQDLQIAYDKDTVKDAPRVGDDGHLSPAEEDELYRYYGLNDSSLPTSAPAADTGREQAEQVDGDTTTSKAGDAGRRDRSEDAGAVGHDTSGPTTDDAMTRSEEQLRVGTTTREAGRARLRKYVVTEQQTATVGVSHEEVTLQREPITDATAGAALDGPAISEEEHEVVLHEEVPVVTTEAHPVERVRMGTQTVTEQQQVSGVVRKEQIEMVDDTDAGRSTAGETTSTSRRKR